MARHAILMAVVRWPLRPAVVMAGALTALASCASPLATTEATTMQAIQMRDYGGPEVLSLAQIPIPTPGPGQVRIQVHAASVNPFDWKQREDRAHRYGPLEFPRIPGVDVAGVIDALGPAVSEWKVGDVVIAALQRAPQGAYAEYVIAPAIDVAAKPRKLSFEEAAGIPTAGMTVSRYLIDAAKPSAGQRVLVHGAAGGVGSIAVQVAKAHGAIVIATASARNHDYLRSIGADEIIDYTAQRFEDRARDIDIVFDTVGGATLDRSYGVIRAGGILVSIAGAPVKARCEAEGIRCTGPGPPGAAGFREALTRIAELADAGKVRVHVDRVLPLAEAAAAQELSRAGHTRGKIVLRVRD